MYVFMHVCMYVCRSKSLTKINCECVVFPKERKIFYFKKKKEFNIRYEIPRSSTKMQFLSTKEI
uniref:Uncharacterized protein n=1 Tax=Octopus bimaculoides TaxID=37653 RepID=A0A0L8GCL5_OCTBM